MDNPTPAEARTLNRAVPQSCNSMHYEGDLPGFALHLLKVHGVKEAEKYLDGWCQSQFVAVDRLHREAMEEEAALGDRM